jgi:hypothetical protein
VAALGSWQKKNVLLTGAAGNMALFYDAQIDIRAVRP